MSAAERQSRIVDVHGTERPLRARVSAGAVIREGEQGQERLQTAPDGSVPQFDPFLIWTPVSGRLTGK